MPRIWIRAPALCVIHVDFISSYPVMGITARFFAIQEKFSRPSTVPSLFRSSKFLSAELGALNNITTKPHFANNLNEHHLNLIWQPCVQLWWMSTAWDLTSNAMEGWKHPPRRCRSRKLARASSSIPPSLKVSKRASLASLVQYVSLSCSPVILFFMPTIPLFFSVHALYVFAFLSCVYRFLQRISAKLKSVLFKISRLFCSSSTPLHTSYKYFEVQYHALYYFL